MYNLRDRFQTMLQGTPKGFKFYASLFLILFLTFGVFGFGYLVISGKLGTLNPNKSEASGTRGVQGDLWADVVLGQPDFNEGMPRERSANRFFNPGGVYIDRSIRPNRVYIADGGNSRILGYKSMGTCSNSASTICTDSGDCTSGGTCNLTQNKNADLIFGQSSQVNGSCNNDASFTTYPNYASATSSTLCFMPQDQISPLEGGQFISMTTDSNHNLYVPDPLNNRVLMYKDPFGAVSNGAGDKVADAVWGQADFSGRGCNRGRGEISPSADSLCIAHESTRAFTSGVDIDTFGNLWVTDTLNNRVLRFPYNSTLGRPATSADLVFGQTNFTTNNNTGIALNQMRQPGALNVHPVTGAIYVLDTYYDNPDNDGFGRVLKFTPPFTNGMYATSWGDPSRPFNLPTGIEFSNDNNSVWISDSLNHMVEQWNLAGTQITNILYKDSWVYGEGYQGLPCSGGGEICYQDDTRGSIGITSNGDIFLASSSNNQNVIRFKSPIRTFAPGSVTSADFSLTSPFGMYNNLTFRSFGSPIGVEAVNNQLIVSDNWRLMFWDNASSLTNFKPATGILVQNTGDYMDPHPYGRIRADKNNHLYVTHGENIEIYNLPLTTSSQPIKTIGFNLTDISGTSVNMGVNGVGGYMIGGLYPADDGSYLWIASRDTNRVIRLRNPLSSDPRVDVVLGQSNSTDATCNLDGNMFNVSPNLNTLCQPGAVTMDNLGNVYVSDSSLENQGNMRLLKYNSSRFPKNNTTMIFGSSSPADKIWFYTSQDSRRNTVEPVFDITNKLLVGYNPYSYVNSSHSIEYFNDIEANGWQNPSGIFNDYMTFPYSMDFDENQNLYVVDMNRFKVLKYLKPFTASVPSTPTSAPTLTPATATPTNRPTAVPTIKATLKPTNKPTSTPTSKPTITPKPTPIPCSALQNSVPQNYCPDNTVSRDQLAVFLLKIISLISHDPRGAGYTPPATSKQTFNDVPSSYWAYSWIEDFSKRGITKGCTTTLPLKYCPAENVTQAQMAVFFLKAEHGSAYQPPAVGASTGFTDVPVDHWAAAWMKQMVAEGISKGCDKGYCPDNFVPRWQMAQYLLKAEHGSKYVPPTITDGKSCFADVAATDLEKGPWIRQLSGEKITGGFGPASNGCGANGKEVIN